MRGENIIVGQKAVLFDLDGVLTGTLIITIGLEAHDQRTGYDLPEEFRGRRGFHRRPSGDFDYFGLEIPRKKTEVGKQEEQHYIES